MRFRRLKAWIAALSFAALATAPAVAQVPDPYAQQLAQQLAVADTAQTQHEFSRAAGPFSGGAAQGQGQRFVVTLRAGQAYRVAGVCDSNCSDLDLRLFDPNGALAAQDIAPDDAPVVDITPSVTGGYTIEAGVAQCAEASCFFAFNVYAR